MCAKHIVAAGIERVIFLEPYPKSLAFDLHADALLVEGSDRGRYRDFPAVMFEHFFGVTPRRYSDLFGRTSRKSRGDGKLIPYAEKNGFPKPYIDIKFPFYSALEGEIITRAPNSLMKASAGA